MFAPFVLMLNSIVATRVRCNESLLHALLPGSQDYFWFSGLRLLTVLPACHISLSRNSFEFNFQLFAMVGL